MESILIVGGNLNKRREKAIKISNSDFRVQTRKVAIKSRQFQISNIDTFILEAENSIGIDQIRDLERKISRKPYLGKFKTAIIPEAEKLTQEAQNALLKTLEEPPEDTLIILTAPKESFLLPTIVSRCKIIRLKAEAEISLSNKEITQLLNFLISLLSTGVGERIKKAESIAKTREETKVFLDQLTFFLREILLTKSSQSSHLTQSHTVVHLCAKLTSRQIVKVIKNLLKTKEVVEKNVNFKLALENFFLDLPYLKC